MPCQAQNEAYSNARSPEHPAKHGQNCHIKPSGMQPLMPFQAQAQAQTDLNARTTKEAWPPSHERALLPIKARFEARFEEDSTDNARTKLQSQLKWYATADAMQSPN
jgi:hypothetical protein